MQAELSEKRARFIRYQLTVAKLPLAKGIEDFDFFHTPVNEPLIRDLAGGTFVADQRNLVLVDGTGMGNSRLALAIARALIHHGACGHFSVVDLVDRLETKARAGWQGRIADQLTRFDFVVFDGSAISPSPWLRTAVASRLLIHDAVAATWVEGAGSCRFGTGYEPVDHAVRKIAAGQTRCRYIENDGQDSVAADAYACMVSVVGRPRPFPAAPLDLQGYVTVCMLIATSRS